MVVKPTAAEVMQDAPVIPVIVLDDVAQAAALARALVAGGIRMLEVTLRTVPAPTTASGTSRAIVSMQASAADAQAAAMAGARFAVSPGYTHAVGKACHDLSLALLPGVATGSEIMAAQEDGYTALKFFPAMQAGGVAMLKAWQGPFPDVKFCPTGGVNAGNAGELLALANVVCRRLGAHHAARARGGRLAAMTRYSARWISSIL
jgi:2-dehydro-3-deoxyphosphogluconate aldolase / (4S)-4-hydroxy-2-oxoglutarate aldolase